ncbi:META domain-containing protein, partial [Nocardioides sp.]|uniref:META domain-containing protein n=1 Tax=Nocardioides sp. TaxID=35761 RepID=UPI0027372879
PPRGVRGARSRRWCTVATGDPARSRLVGLLPAGAVMAGALMAGCAAQGGGSSPGDLEAALEGRTFLTRTVTQDGQLRPLADGSELRLTFTGGQLRMNAGCNHLSGDYELDEDGVLVVGPIGGTEMGCPAGLMEQDLWLAELFTEPVDVGLAEETLSLTSGGTVLTLTDRRVASPDAPLVGTRWRLTTLVDGETAGSVREEIPARIELTEDGRLLLQTGCNNGQGSVEVDAAAGTLTIDLKQITRAACEGDVADVERAMLAVLDGEVEYAVEEQALTLSKGTQGLGFASPSSDR